MTCWVESNVIPTKYLKNMTLDDVALCLRDLIVFGCLAYEVTTDENNEVVSVKYSMVYRITT